MPPAVNCHEVKVSADTGGCQRRLSTVPSAMDAALAKPAAMPTGSSAALGVSTSSATPARPLSAATTDRLRIGAPSTVRASRITTSGWIAPKVAATPPGRRYAATNSSAQNTEKFSAPRMNARSHQMPCGNWRTASSSRMPAGSARSMATVSG
ncbi:hypothetical protein G6F40_015615 [Rhizopus arrhizus]|nr:hypothetical protein G6F40_015615 [Rhizopus arrhizus]